MAEKSELARILIVDDEPLNVDLLVQELGDRGYTTDAAYGGREALNKVAANPPDLILLDVIMPDIDGITVCRMLKEDPATRLIPVVIMTALEATEDRVRGIEAGADDFLTKPVDDRELLARIGTALKTKRAIDQTVGELESASAQLDRLGAHEEHVSVIVAELEPARSGETADAGEARSFVQDRYRAAYADVLAMFSGEVHESDGNRLIAVVRTRDSDDHARLAVEAALALRAETETLNLTNSVDPLLVKIGIDTGSATIGSARVQQDSGTAWELAVEGPVVDGAAEAAAGADGAGIVASSRTISLTKGRFDTEDLDEWSRVIGPRPSEEAGAQSTSTDVSEQPTTLRSGTLPWPASYADLEAVLRHTWGVSDLYLNRVLSGKSGALVYSVDITSQDFAGQAILKLSELGDPTWDEKDEAARHRDAIDANESYAEAHLPEIVSTLEHEGRSAVLASIAARGLEYSVPWAHCAYEVQLDSALKLSSGLLEGWNEAYEFVEGVVAPQDVLAEWLKYRLDPAEGGRLHDLLATEGGIDPEAPTFFHDGHWYPNPLAFAIGAVDISAEVKIRAVAGNMHGDLHGFNVLVGRANGDPAYHLIDLAFYEPGAFLLFDHAYFEVSHLLRQRGTEPLAGWVSVVDALERGAPPRGDDIGLLQLLDAVRQEVWAWVDRHEPNRLSYLESQFMLARIGAGLNFSHKRMPIGDRVRALLYAAGCLKSYVKFHNLDWPKQGDALTLSS